MARVRDMLTDFAGAEGHRFWPDSVSILEPKRLDLAGAGPKNVTDLDLLRLAAVAVKGRLIAFDRTIRWQWVTGCGPDDLEILPGPLAA